MPSLRPLSLALWLALPLSGGLAGSAQALDLLESFQAALSEDPEYRMAQAAADAGREVVPMARAQLFPNLSLSYSRFQNYLNTRSTNILGQTSSYDSDYPSENAGLTLRQPIYRPYIYAGYQQSKARLEGVEATLSLAQQDLALRVSSAYFDALLAEEGLSLVLVQQRAISAQLDAAKKAMLAGQGTRTDVDDAQARLDLTLAKALSARQQIELARHDLQRLINAPVNALNRLDDSKLSLAPLGSEPLEAWMSKAEAQNPELRALKARLDATRLEIDRALAGHKPTLDLVVQRTLSESDNVTNPDARYINNQIGLQFAMPLYAGGYVSAQVRQARAATREAEHNLETARRKLHTQVRKEYQAIEAGILKIQALALAQRSAEQAVISNQKGFVAGVRTRIGILDAEQQLGQVRMELAKERLNYVVARLRLLTLVDGLNLETITTVNRWFSAGSLPRPN